MSAYERLHADDFLLLSQRGPEVVGEEIFKQLAVPEDTTGCVVTFTRADGRTEAFSFVRVGPCFFLESVTCQPRGTDAPQPAE